MERLLELILGGGLRLPLFDSDLLALDREFPRSDLLALLMLQRRGELTMSELAADMGAPLSTATGIGARLARRGLAERRRAAEDKRVVLLTLTAAGEDLAGRIRTQVTNMTQRIQSVLTPDEIQQLTGLVLKAISALSAAPVEAPEGQTIPGPESRRIFID